MELGDREREILAEEYERSLTAEQKLLVDAFRFGQDTIEFIKNNKVGRYIVDRAETERQDALQAFLNAPADLEEHRLRRIKARADAADKVLSWLEEAIMEGNEAAALLQQEDEATDL